MDCSENISGTLRAQEHGHQPLVYENHGIDSRYTGPHKVCSVLVPDDIQVHEVQDFRMYIQADTDTTGTSAVG